MYNFNSQNTQDVNTSFTDYSNYATPIYSLVKIMLITLTKIHILRVNKDRFVMQQIRRFKVDIENVKHVYVEWIRHKNQTVRGILAIFLRDKI